MLRARGARGPALVAMCRGVSRERLTWRASRPLPPIPARGAFARLPLQPLMVMVGVARDA